MRRIDQDLPALFWSLSQLGSGLEALARRSELQPSAVQVPPPPSSIAFLEDSAASRDALNQWIESAATWLGLEAEPSAVPYEDLERLIQNAGPAVLQVPGNGAPRFLFLLPRNRGHVSVLAPDLRAVPLPLEAVRALLCRTIEQTVAPEIDGLLNDAAIPDARRGVARAALLLERLRTKEVGGCWQLRQSPGTTFWSQAKRAGLPRRLGTLLVAHAAEYFLLITSWWLIGRAALSGHLDNGWLLAWALILLTVVPFHVYGTWLQGFIAVNGGLLFKQRLLFGTLRLKPEEIRHKGVGQFLGQVMESEAVELLAVTAGFQGLTAVVELIAAEIVLTQGEGRALELLLLPLWVGLTLFMAVRYFRRRQRWTELRLSMTNDLTERMVGHRTRLAQEARQKWHEGEDEELERYLELSESTDAAAALLTALAPRGWLILGTFGLTWAFVASEGLNIRLAISLGGILLGYRALKRISTGLVMMADAVISWQKVAPLFEAAARRQLQGSPAVALTPVSRNDAKDDTRDGDNGKDPVMEAHDLLFRYQDRGEPVLKGCSLTIRRGERLLLEGSSGGGKSTLASLLVGLRVPQSGLLLLHGLDRQTLGDQGWRQRVVSAPQFHENHVLSETFAFNLLMGRRWPPREEDMREASAICAELGLEPLLNKMPAGMLQMVGETGWQLSHGERSRVYIARALLQGAEIVIFDESFAALDPENVRLALDCVLRRASTLLVVAHP
ncbi:MAG TPA: ABC transporter ATP-binding protein [Terriglobales bacterium]|nr:ABC transporter ATP-binding protein [Terriglobales bacterium]